MRRPWPRRRDETNGPTRDEVRQAYLWIAGRRPGRIGQRRWRRQAASGSEVTPQLLRETLLAENGLRRDPIVHNPTQAYLGYLPEDLRTLEALVPKKLPEAGRYFVDAFGQRYDADIHPGVAERVGTTTRELPFPDDGHLSEAIEYVAGALALRDARGNETFVAVELGAGWGPWSTFFALVAGQRGFSTVRIAAFEADAARFDLMRRHLAQNQVIDADEDDHGSRDNLEWRLYSAAAWHEDTTLLWPADANPLDAGMRAEEVGHQSETDYRGNAITFNEIPALDIRAALDDVGPIDIMHIDLQGGEQPLFPHVIDWLDGHVKRMMLGTHSRLIEGEMIDLLRARGWVLEREKPCQFAFDPDITDVVGMTWCDGAQVWRNRAFLP